MFIKNIIVTYCAYKQQKSLFLSVYTCIEKMCVWAGTELADVGKIGLLIFKGAKKLHQCFFKIHSVRFAGISCVHFQGRASAFREGNFNMETEVLFI